MEEERPLCEHTDLPPLNSHLRHLALNLHQNHIRRVLAIHPASTRVSREEEALTGPGNSLLISCCVVGSGRRDEEEQISVLVACAEYNKYKYKYWRLSLARSHCNAALQTPFLLTFDDLHETDLHCPCPLIFFSSVPSLL